MTIRENSLQTYHEIKPKLSGRRAQVFNFICRNEPCTEREIKIGLNLPDMNSVRPRCTELIKSGVIEEEKTIRDSATGRPCRVLRVTRTEPIQEKLL